MGAERELGPENTIEETLEPENQDSAVVNLEEEPLPEVEAQFSIEELDQQRLDRAIGVSKHLRDIRVGPPGEIRPDLTSGHVATILNDQLMHFSEEEIQALVDSYEPEDRELVLTALFEATQFATIESLEAVSRASGGLSTYMPQSGDLAGNLNYLNYSKHVFDTSITGVDKIGTSQLVLLDDSLMARIQADPGVAEELVKNGTKIQHPEGYFGGIGVFQYSTLAEIKEAIDPLISRAKELAWFKPADAIRKALQEDVHKRVQQAVGNEELAEKIVGLIEFVGGDRRDAEAPSAATIAKRLNSTLGISVDQVDSSLSGLPEGYRQTATEVLVRKGRTFSHITITETLRQLHRRITKHKLATEVDPKHIYYAIRSRGKSYGIINMAYMRANGVSPEQIIGPNDPEASGKYEKAKLVVVLDDYCGSGSSLNDQALGIRERYSGPLIVAPMVLSSRSLQPGMSLRTRLQSDQKFGIAFGVVTRPTEKTPLAKDLSKQERQLVDTTVGSKGHSSTDETISFPYMIPDNVNNLWSLVGKSFSIRGKGNKGGAYSTPSKSAIEDTVKGEVQKAIQRLDMPAHDRDPISYLGQAVPLYFELQGVDRVIRKFRLDVDPKFAEVMEELTAGIRAGLGHFANQSGRDFCSELSLTEHARFTESTRLLARVTQRGRTSLSDDAESIGAMHRVAYDSLLNRLDSSWAEISSRSQEPLAPEEAARLLAQIGEIITGTAETTLAGRHTRSINEVTPDIIKQIPRNPDSIFKEIIEAKRDELSDTELVTLLNELSNDLYSQVTQIREVLNSVLAEDDQERLADYYREVRLMRGEFGSLAELQGLLNGDVPTTSNGIATLISAASRAGESAKRINDRLGTDFSVDYEPIIQQLQSGLENVVEISDNPDINFLSRSLSTIESLSQDILGSGSNSPLAPIREKLQQTAELLETRLEGLVSKRIAEIRNQEQDEYTTDLDHFRRVADEFSELIHSLNRSSIQSSVAKVFFDHLEEGIKKPLREIDSPEAMQEFITHAYSYNTLLEQAQSSLSNVSYLFGFSSPEGNRSSQLESLIPDYRGTVNTLKRIAGWEQELEHATGYREQKPDLKNQRNLVSQIQRGYELRRELGNLREAIPSLPETKKLSATLTSLDSIASTEYGRLGDMVKELATQVDSFKEWIQLTGSLTDGTLYGVDTKTDSGRTLQSALDSSKRIAAKLFESELEQATSSLESADISSEDLLKTLGMLTDISDGLHMADVCRATQREQFLKTANQALELVTERIQTGDPLQSELHSAALRFERSAGYPWEIDDVMNNIKQLNQQAKDSALSLENVSGPSLKSLSGMSEKMNSSNQSMPMETVYLDEFEELEYMEDFKEDFYEGEDSMLVGSTEDFKTLSESEDAGIFGSVKNLASKTFKKFFGDDENRD